MNGTVVISGAASGIGAAVARRCHEDGSRVIGLDLRWPDDVAGVDEQRVVDVCSLNELLTVADDLRERGDRVTGLVCAAGISGRVTLESVSEQRARQILDINLLGVLMTMRAFGPLMLEQQEGAVVNISSATALRARAAFSIYGAAKAGVLQATRVAAVEWASRGVRVNAVLPGPIDTPLLRQGARLALDLESGAGEDDEDMDQVRVERALADAADRVPLGRIGTPDDVAQAVLFLLSTRAAYITGEGLSVSGGSILGFRRER